MAAILLIHGAAHGAWAWTHVLPQLAALGHAARAIDLPGHGEDPTPVGDVTLDMYAEAVVAALHGFDDPVVLVGHSMGGYPISLAAERAPDRVARLVYVCAYLPWPGTSLADMRRAAPRQPLLPAIRRSHDGVWLSLDPEQVEEKFYHDCPPGTLELARPRLCRQAIAPQETPIALGPAFGAVPKSYVICDDDRAIPPEFQATMCADLPRRDVHRMACGHSPFFADPAGLAHLIDACARPRPPGG